MVGWIKCPVYELDNHLVTLVPVLSISIKKKEIVNNKGWDRKNINEIQSIVTAVTKSWRGGIIIVITQSSEQSLPVIIH